MTGVASLTSGDALAVRLDLAPADVPSATRAAVARAIEKVLAGLPGFVVLHCSDIEHATDDIAAGEVVLTLASSVDASLGQDMTDKLLQHDADAPDFHTDAAPAAAWRLPGVIGLVMLRPAASGGNSFLAGGRAVHDARSPAIRACSNGFTSASASIAPGTAWASSGAPVSRTRRRPTASPGRRFRPRR